MRLWVRTAVFRRAAAATAVVGGAIILTGATASSSPSSSDWLWVVIVDEAAKFLTAIAAFGAVLTAIIAYFDYKSKARSSATHDEIALATAFTDLLSRADGRLTTVASEAAVNKLFETGVIKDQNPQSIRTALESAATLGVGNGAAAQAAAIECVIYFGTSYEMLKRPAREGLRRVAEHAATQPHREQAEHGVQRLSGL